MSNTTYNKDLLPEFDSVRDNDEEILWANKPRFIPYIITSLGVVLTASIFSGIFYAFTLTNKSDDWSFNRIYRLFVALPIVFSLISFSKKLFSYTKTRYAYTNRRVMIRSGA
jgi:ABC-type sugar transport system permease subunit